MKKSITIDVSKEQVNALSTVLNDALDYYSTLNNNSAELHALREVFELNNSILESFYLNETVKQIPNYSEEPINKLSLSHSTIKFLKELSIFTIGDLMSYTKDELIKYRYMKGKKIQDIEQALSEIGLKLSKK